MKAKERVKSWFKVCYLKTKIIDGPITARMGKQWNTDLGVLQNHCRW